MLNRYEKAYCLALEALKKREYKSAVEQFEIAAPFFVDNSEFALFRETTGLLVSLQESLPERKKVNEIIEIEEIF